MWCATHGGLVVDPRKTTQHYGWRVFDRVWPENSVVAVPRGIRGGTWHHHKRCIKAKQLRVVVRSKSKELVHVAPAKWICSMYLGIV
jgi:hypothetical protein